MSATDPAAIATPTLTRRFASFVYEGVLLFGVVMGAGFVYGIATQQRHALVGLHGLQAFVFAVLGLYFVWCWTHGGQTLAMKTWHIRLQAVDGGPVTVPRAIARYLLAWLWFMPGLVAVWLSGLKGSGPATAALVANVAGYAALVWLHPQRQFWHDAICATRLVDTRTHAQGTHA